MPCIFVSCDKLNKLNMAKKETTKKNKGKVEKAKAGQPTSYKEEYNEQARKLCLLGYIDIELASFFNVCEATINNWKKEYPKFLESIKKGKEVADMEIVESLRNRAIGMTIQSEKAFKIKTGQYTEEIEIVTVNEGVAPDPASMFFWLKNRQPNKWRDKQEIDHTTKGESLNDISKLSTAELLERAKAVKKLNE